MKKDYWIGYKKLRKKYKKELDSIQEKQQIELENLVFKIPKKERFKMEKIIGEPLFTSPKTSRGISNVYFYNLRKNKGMENFGL